MKYEVTIKNEDGSLTVLGGYARTQAEGLASIQLFQPVSQIVKIEFIEFER